MRRSAHLLLILSLSGCSLLEQPTMLDVPELITPPAWSAKQLTFTNSDQNSALANYPQLIELINEAFQNNPALIAARLDVDTAVAISKQAAAQEWPTVDAFLNTGRQKANDNIANSHSLKIDVTWQLDLLGKLDDLTKAATLDAKQSVLSYQHEQNKTLALISQQWFQLIFTQQQYALIQKRTANLQQNLDIIENGYEQGVNQSLDVYLARADLARAHASSQDNLASLKETQRALEISLGRYPTGTIIANGDLTFATTAIPEGLPSDLLLRRFDLQRAIFKLSAENLRLANAYKNRFPSLSLSLSGGQSSPELKDLLSAQSVIWSLFANASTPIFNAGSLKAKQQQQAITAKKAANAITSATLQAFIEVENSLSAESMLAQQEVEQIEAATYFATAEQLSFEQYIAGITSYITALESQRSAYDAQTTLISIKHSRIQNRIQLLLALGGSLPEEVVVSKEATNSIYTTFKDSDSVNN